MTGDAQASHGEARQLDASHGEVARPETSHGEARQLDASHGEARQLDASHGEAARLDAAFAGRPIPPDLHRGRDGWLFWIGRRDVILPLYRHRPGTWRRLWHWRRLVDARVAQARSLGARYLQAVVPDKLSVYDHKLSIPLVDAGLAPSARLGRAVARRHPAVWVDLLGPFRAGRDAEPLYMRTDTHWSRAGYALGYRLLCRALGAEPAPHVLDARVETVRIANDLGHKFDPPIEEPSEFAHWEGRARRLDENALVTFREALSEHVVGTSVGSRLVFGNDEPAADPRRIVVFGDSYLFHPGGLGPMLAETFAETHLLWSSPIDWTYVERVRPDLVVHELAERFLFRLPADRIDIDAFAAERLAEARARRGAA